MRAVGVREFRDQATTMMGAGETLVIERHGEPICFYVPTATSRRRSSGAVLARADVVRGRDRAAASFLGTGVATWTTETLQSWLDRS